MSYDPFARGPHPVGVRTLSASDPSRQDRPLTFEIWYPATDVHAGEDLARETRDHYDLLPGFPPSSQTAVRDAEARPEKFPLVAFSHGFGGHRRQTTFLCTHLASHGYVVAAADHTGNTIFDVIQAVMTMRSGGPLPDARAMIREFIAARPADVSFLIDRLLGAGLDGFARLVDPERIGMSGHSFGGWTTLAVTARDRRVRAALPLAPAGGSSPLPVDVMKQALDFEWGRDVPTLYLVADRDTLLPLAGMLELYERTRATKKMVVLKNADHMHFCDDVEQIHELFRMMPPPGDFERLAKLVPPISELCSGEDAYLFVRGLGLAHMDAHLKGSEAAARFLAGDLVKALDERGVAVEVV